MLELPALDPLTVEPRTGSAYPEPFKSQVTPREKRGLAAALGLVHIGVNLTTLPPGMASSMRHAHTKEEEFVFVVDGELTLITNAGEQPLTAGMCAGFPPGSGEAHHLVNRSSAPATYLEISNHDPEDGASYPDVNLVYKKGPDGRPLFFKKSGEAY